MNIRIFKVGLAINEQVRRVRVKQELYLPFVIPSDTDIIDQTGVLILRHTLLNDELTIINRSREQWMQVANMKFDYRANERAQEIKQQAPVLYCYHHPHAEMLPEQHPLSHAQADIGMLLSDKQFPISGREAADIFLNTYEYLKKRLIESIIKTEDQLDELAAIHEATKVSA